MTGEIDQLDLGRQLGELTAAVKANTEAHLANTSRIKVIEDQMSDFIAARKSIKWLTGVAVFLAGIFGSKIADWVAASWHWVRP